MKQTIFCYLILSVFALSVLSSCSKDDEFNPDNQDSDEVTFDASRKILVAYFSATGTTQRLSEQIISVTGADAFRIEAANPYAVNPYDDSDRIQDESYNDRRPAVATLPDNVEDYDVIFIGSPIWWHNPAMVVCTFLESYNLNGKIIVPFFTYGATTYLQQSIDKIYEVTPQSLHLRTYSGNGGVENWLRNIHIIE
ncbi:flavodoxin [Bacteroides intestinalis]|uniref:flavodoxin n=1 Tax=Bacteroides intestinalis TaxID=329854 RepID=UPI00189E90D9|nr:flavodoxin [Bacteroides intestinalis]